MQVQEARGQDILSKPLTRGIDARPSPIVQANLVHDRRRTVPLLTGFLVLRRVLKTEQYGGLVVSFPYLSFRGHFALLMGFSSLFLYRLSQEIAVASHPVPCMYVHVRVHTYLVGSCPTSSPCGTAPAGVCCVGFWFQYFP